MAVFGVHFRSFSMLLERFYSIKIFIPKEGRPFLSKFRNFKFLIFRFIYTLKIPAFLVPAFLVPRSVPGSVPRFPVPGFKDIAVTVCRVVKSIHDPYQIDSIGHVCPNVHHQKTFGTCKRILK